MEKPKKKSKKKDNYIGSEFEDHVRQYLQTKDDEYFKKHIYPNLLRMAMSCEVNYGYARHIKSEDRWIVVNELVEAFVSCLESWDQKRPLFYLMSRYAKNHLFNRYQAQSAEDRRMIHIDSVGNGLNEATEDDKLAYLMNEHYGWSTKSGDDDATTFTELVEHGIADVMKEVVAAMRRLPGAHEKGFAASKRGIVLTALEQTDWSKIDEQLDTKYMVKHGYRNILRYVANNSGRPDIVHRKYEKVFVEMLRTWRSRGGTTRIINKILQHA